MESRRRGRPVLVDPEELGRRALAVIAEHGYAAVTMGQIAAEAGVSVRTLHRYFPSKADVVWGPLSQAVTKLRDALAAVDPEVPLLTAIEEAVVSVFDPLVEADEAERTRLQLIATTPELHEYQSEPFQLWRRDLVAFAATRLGLDPDDVVPAAIASATQSATLVALTWWATHEDAGAPGDVARRALGALDDGIRVRE